MTATAETPDSVHAFWFGAEADDAVVATRRAALWWGKNAAVDAEMRLRFGATVAAAAAGGLDGWAASPRGLLALVLVTDQFPRNIHRNTRAAFDCDPLARGWCRRALDAGVDAALRPIERVFLYLPLEHSESPSDQDDSVARFTALAGVVEPRLTSTFTGYLDFAARHREVIRRFGRFPHRNAILGRASTVAESAFLAEPGSSF